MVVSRLGQFRQLNFVTTDFRQSPPPPDLALFVQHYWTMTGTQAEGLAHPIFPDGAPELVFNFGDPVQQLRDDGPGFVVQPKAIFVGQMTRAVWIVPTGRIRMIGVKLAAWGAAAFFGDAGVWRDRIVALPDHWADMDAMDAGRMNEVLRARLAIGSGARQRGLTAAARALSEQPIWSIDAWSRRLGWSPRTLERRFDEYIGLSPKEFLRIHRFQRALRLVTESPQLTLGTVAARAGYCDQSHLAREFRAFAGAPPSVALSTVTAVSTHFVGDETDPFS